MFDTPRCGRRKMHQARRIHYKKHLFSLNENLFLFEVPTMRKINNTRKVYIFKNRIISSNI